mmetsp:Transcript_40904/g.53590  ORF Transcript_40904/g.53590 Transcript_40904/m.53590 type:complete len:179 (-) Transcript_40904:356-892(-)
MELEFEHAVVSSQQMNGMLATYEATLLENYGSSGINKRRMSARETGNGTARATDDHYLIFDPDENAEVRSELENLPSKMQNPFSNMRRWLKFELLDLRAILQAIEKKNEMDNRRKDRIRKRDNDKETLQMMREGKKTLRTLFMSKDSKISRITNLTNSISATERDIECLELLHKIIVL